MDRTSPSDTTTPPGAVIRPPLTSTSSSSAPQTQVLPIPRATTAAWLVLPPRLVRMPVAAIIPCRSSGFVSRRTRMTSSPAAASSTARAELNTTLPTAAPGDALTPVVIFFAPEPTSKRGNISRASCSPVTRVSASSISIRPWSTSWVAMRNAAAAVRLPRGAQDSDERAFPGRPEGDERGHQGGHGGEHHRRVTAARVQDQPHQREHRYRGHRHMLALRPGAEPAGGAEDGHAQGQCSVAGPRRDHRPPAVLARRAVLAG